MKSQTSLFKELYHSHDDFKRRLDNFDRVSKTDEWKFLQDMILSMKGDIIAELLSKRFTELPLDQKNTQQIVYYKLMESLNFLASPVKWIKKKSRIQTFNQNLGKQLKKK